MCNQQLYRCRLRLRCNWIEQSLSIEGPAWMWIYSPNNMAIKPVATAGTQWMHMEKLTNWTRTTSIVRLRSEIPPTATWLSILVIHIKCHVKQDKVKVRNSNKMPKIQMLKFCKKLNPPHPLKLLKYKFEMHPTRTVGTTEGTRNAGRPGGRSEINITPYPLPPPPPPPPPTHTHTHTHTPLPQHTPQHTHPHPHTHTNFVVWGYKN